MPPNPDNGSTKLLRLLRLLRLKVLRLLRLHSLRVTMIQKLGFEPKSVLSRLAVGAFNRARPVPWTARSGSPAIVDRFPLEVEK